MHTPRLYLSQPIEESTSVDLPSEQSHHLAKVLRIKVGRQVILFNEESNNGQQGEFRAEVKEVGKKTVTVFVNEFIPRIVESPLSITLGVCIIKNDRMDWLLQKATEMGVASIQPLFSDYTDVKISAERLEKKLKHWQQIVINACEQSGRIKVPVVEQPQKLLAWVETVEAQTKCVLHPYCESQLQTDKKTSSVALLVGPEGGLSEQEVASAQLQGFVGLTLGPRILRAETAPIAAMSLLQHWFGDF